MVTWVWGARGRVGVGIYVAVKISPHPHSADCTRGIPGEYPRAYPGNLKPVSATTWENTRGIPQKGGIPRVLSHPHIETYPGNTPIVGPHYGRKRGVFPGYNLHYGGGEIF